MYKIIVETKQVPEHTVLSCEQKKLDAAVCTSPPNPATSDDSCDRVYFNFGNPGVESISGVIHVFKNSPTQRKPPNTDTAADPAVQPPPPMPNSTLLCILAVPSYLTTSEFIRFVSGFNKSIRYMKLLRDNSPTKYMVLAKFDSQQITDDFYFAYNGKRFNLLEVSHQTFQL